MLSAFRHSFELFIILNGHGGNISAIQKACLRTWLDSKIKSIIVHWWILAREFTRQFFKKEADYAGVGETAVILAIDEELVKKEL